MRFGFLIKAAVAAILVVSFDRLFPLGFTGAAIGAFAAAWLAGVAIARADVRRDPGAWRPLAMAALFAASLVDDPGVLGWTLFWCALAMAALWPRTAGFDDAWRWGVRLLLHAGSTVIRPVDDLRRGLRRPRRARRGLRASLAVLAFPLAGGAIFVILFAAANPVIAQALAAIRLPAPWRVAAWVAVAFGVWPSLRPHPAVTRITARLPCPEPALPGTSLPSVLIALALFNALFAVQNVLDAAILWGGGPLPGGMTQTEYVHRGAYPLIVTALIAGVMALAMLRPGTASERHPWARRMLVVWVAQNLILVASSALRTVDYIAASMLTEWRIAALAWMALVALGLVLICWRILKGRSARWLINRNAAAAALVLTPCTFLDLGGIAATWNVRHHAPSAIDLCYLQQVGDGALLPLLELEGRPLAPATRAKVRHVRHTLLADLAARQDTWTRWTPRGARRLAKAQARVPRGQAGDAPGARHCDGSPVAAPATHVPS